MATILSAQCTDKRVNIVTSSLFKKYKSVQDYAKAKQKEFEKDIKSAGFYRNKSKNIINSAKIIVDKFFGKVPKTLKELISLPGVARKTATVVLFNGFNRIEGITVDTHVKRLAQRMGLSKNSTPEKVEKDLMSLLPKKLWGKIGHILIEHGRSICIARRPLCYKCPLKKVCPSYKYFMKLYYSKA